MKKKQLVRFRYGQLTATPGALRTFQPEDLSRSFRRHLLNDWGDLDDEDWAMNNAATRNGTRILSAYKIRSETLWIITEADRSYTTMLLPDEY